MRSWFSFSRRTRSFFSSKLSSTDLSELLRSSSELRPSLSRFYLFSSSFFRRFFFESEIIFTWFLAAEPALAGLAFEALLFGEAPFDV